MKTFSVQTVQTLSIGVFLAFTSFTHAVFADSGELSLCEKVSLEARSGDLIFIAIDSFVFKQIAFTTNTWASHVGIIFRENNDWVIYESRVPKSTVTPLCHFLDRAMGDMVEVRRYQQPLTRSTVQFLKSEATDRLGYFYHTGFDYDDNNRMFCSKYIYDIFMQAGIEVGKIETLNELFAQNPNTDVNFWYRWYLGRIPWERRTVTPASQITDPKFTTVFSNNIEIENSHILRVNALKHAH